MKRLAGKVAVITGAGSGMGRAMVELFAVEGAMVVAADWHQDALDETVALAIAEGGSASGIQGNVAVREQAETIIEEAFTMHGRIDVLCNNAGVMDLQAGVGEVTDEMWERVIGINLNGPMYLTRKVVPIMVAQGGGSIVNTASVAGLSGAAAGVAYTVSKHGLVGLTKNTAWVYTQSGVRCNAIAAGAVETNIMQSVDPTKMDPIGTARYGIYQGILPGMLKPVDIAQLALFLASDESKMINGAIIPADAGWLSA